MFERSLRVVYVLEFLVALIAALDLWREAGGQGHLDIMPWYWKLFLPLGLALAAVRTTAASVAMRKRATMLWGLFALTIVITGGLLTYYYHLNEPMDSAEEESLSLSAKS